MSKLTGERDNSEYNAKTATPCDGNDAELKTTKFFTRCHLGLAICRLLFGWSLIIACAVFAALVYPFQLSEWWWYTIVSAFYGLWNTLIAVAGIMAAKNNSLIKVYAKINIISLVFDILLIAASVCLVVMFTSIKRHLLLMLVWISYGAVDIFIAMFIIAFNYKYSVNSEGPTTI